MNAGITRNLKQNEEFGEEVEALPSVILDVNGEIITEFFSDEKREYIGINELPKDMIYAIVTREDGEFFYHRGFSVLGTIKAVVDIVLKGYVRGASTLTQQLAGNLYADRVDISLTRKLRELWWSYQMERQLTKHEILERYLNKVPFGHNTYGVETASEFFFDHSASENSVAEAAMLVIQVANPSGVYSPFRNPDYARDRQTYVLDRMVADNLVDPETAQLSLEQYWSTFDWTKDNYSSAFFDRLEDDRAPWFSEYIRRQLEEMLYGQQDFYRDGFMVHTTLDLDLQEAADRRTAEWLEKWEHTYQNSLDTRRSYADQSLTDLVELLSLTFNIEGIRVAGAQERTRAREYFFNELNPTIDMMSQIFGLGEVNFLSNAAYGLNQQRNRQSTLQTAMLTLGNQDYNEGYISALVGGSQFSRTNQLIRAIDAELSPGSSFKPLYYSAAISSRNFTAASRLLDKPMAFTNPDGTTYTLDNFMGEWQGSVLLRRALANSMNIPSVIVMDGIGFEAAIERGAALLGIEDPVEIERVFPRVYPLALGIIRVAPIDMAKAYATISNYGTAVEPLAIRYIEDRDGNVILNPERELRDQQSREDRQVMPPQDAYIMISLLKSVITDGTLRNRTNHGRWVPDIDFGGKTGTTQNWADAWTCGFSPYYTTVWWLGFDERGAGSSTLGLGLTGSTATGRAWAAYMADIHVGLPPASFPRPDQGTVEIEVCSLSGQKPTDQCEHTYAEVFLTGTAPTQLCEIHAFNQDLIDDKASQLRTSISGEGIDFDLSDTMNSDGESLDDLIRSLGIDMGDDEEDPDGSNGVIDSGFLD